MFYPNQLVLIPKSYANSNKSRFIKMDGSPVDKNLIPKELEKLTLFECANDYTSCLPYFNENNKVYDVLSENLNNEEDAFSNNDKCASTVVPGECSISLIMNNKNTKLVCTGISILMDDNTFIKHGIYPKEVQIFGYNNDNWINITGLTVIRNIDVKSKENKYISLDWSYKINQIVPCNGFKLTISKWSKLITNVNPCIKSIQLKFKEDKNTINTVNIDCPDEYVYCFDLSSYIQANINSNELALENKIVNLIKKHTNLIEIKSEVEDNTPDNYLADLSNFYNKNIRDINDKLESLENRDINNDLKIITVSDKNNILTCEQSSFQKVVAIGDNLQDKDIKIILPENPLNGDIIKITTLRKDYGKVSITSGDKYKIQIALNDNICEGKNINLVKYGSFIELLFFRGIWIGTLNQ